jgi:hypothetical protein
VSSAPAATAQTAAEQDFSGLAGTRTSIEVIGDTGSATRGRLLRFDANSVSLESGHREITFDRRQVARIYQRGDSLKNGMFIGLGVGAALGSTVGLTSDCGGLFEAARRCTGSEKARRAAILGSTLGALGMGIGVGVDALFSGRRLLYERRSTPAAGIVLRPTVGPVGAALAVSMWW